MILNFHSDTLYLSAPKDFSRVGAYFFLGSVPQDGDPIKLNGSIHITWAILKLVAASAAEAELGALFLNTQEAKVLWLILAELSHPQPPTPIHIDNTTTVGIVNNTIKQQRSQAIEMRYFWLLDEKCNDTSSSTTNPDWKTLAIIHPNIILPTYINTPGHIMSIWTTYPLSYQKLWSQALIKGVLKSLGIPTPRNPHYQALAISLWQTSLSYPVTEYLASQEYNRDIPLTTTIQE
jgi:hypothetical protein